MTSFPYTHHSFDSPRRSLSLSNERCQSILYKTAFEHFPKIDSIAALLLASKSFQNSSFGANFLVNFSLDHSSIGLFMNVLSPSSCFSLQLIPSLSVDFSTDFVDDFSEMKETGIINFLDELVTTKYLPLQLRHLSMSYAAVHILRSFFDNGGRPWPQLQSLSLPFSAVVESIMSLIADSAPHLTSLSLIRCSTVTGKVLQHVVKLSNITSLCVAGCRPIDNIGLQHISELVNVTELNLRGCIYIRDASLEHVSRMSSITILNLSHDTNISDVGLAHISKLSCLTSLDLAGIDSLTDVGIEHISKCSEISSLDLSTCSITDVALRHVAKLTNITTLNICGCRSITDIGLLCLRSLSKMKTLSLSITCPLITKEGKKIFADALPNCRIC